MEFFKKKILPKTEKLDLRSQETIELNNEINERRAKLKDKIKILDLFLDHLKGLASNELRYNERWVDMNKGEGSFRTEKGFSNIVNLILSGHDVLENENILDETKKDLDSKLLELEAVIQDFTKFMDSRDYSEIFLVNDEDVKKIGYDYKFVIGGMSYSIPILDKVTEIIKFAEKYSK